MYPTTTCSTQLTKYMHRLYIDDAVISELKECSRLSAGFGRFHQRRLTARARKGPAIHHLALFRFVSI
jgi:hypothetical protein